MSHAHVLGPKHEGWKFVDIKLIHHQKACWKGYVDATVFKDNPKMNPMVCQ
jgi:hypothetical protein